MPRTSSEYGGCSQMKRSRPRSAVHCASTICEAGNVEEQRVLDLGDDPAAAVAELVGVITHRAVNLGREHDVVTLAAGEGLADDLLGLTPRVHVGGVDEVDPGVQRPVDDADRVVV